MPIGDYGNNPFPQQGEPDVDPKDTDPNDPDYQGPEDGPFRCDNCEFFTSPNRCSQPQVVNKVGGLVDPAGCCKFFDTLSGGEGGEQLGPASLSGLRAAGRNLPSATSSPNIQGSV